MAVTETLAKWQTQTGRATVRLQTDGAKELSKSHVRRFCKYQETDITTPLPNHPASNVHAYRRVNAHKADIHSSLEAAPGEIPDTYWCYAAEDEAILKNLLSLTLLFAFLSQSARVTLSNILPVGIHS